MRVTRLYVSISFETNLFGCLYKLVYLLHFLSLSLSISVSLFLLLYIYLSIYLHLSFSYFSLSTCLSLSLHFMSCILPPLQCYSQGEIEIQGSSLKDDFDRRMAYFLSKQSLAILIIKKVARRWYKLLIS